MRRAWTGLLVGGMLAASAAPAIAQATLEGPVFGLGTAPNGDVVAADASTGIVTIRRGEVTKTIPLPGVTDVAPIGGGSMWAITGAGGDPTEDTGQALYRVSNGQTRLIANLYDVEAELNPDGHDPLDSNPYAVASLGGNAALVADAGANALLRVDVRGHAEVVAVFPDELASTADIKAAVGCPDAPEELAFVCELPETIPAEPVPTSIAIGPDGHYYVGELKGFPAPLGVSNIWRIAPGASWAECGSSPDCVKVFDGGFTAIIDLAFGHDGTLYVAELDEAGWLAAEGFGTPAGGTINACDVSTGNCQVVQSGIPLLTALTVDKDGGLWATRNALIPGQAEVFQVQ